MRTLRLTSPNMKGPDVKEAQKSLRHYYKGKLDSIYGPKTALAVKQAKYDLGYAEKNITSTYDEQFVQYYSKAKSQTLLMRQRAKQRAKKQSKAEAVISSARQFIGVSEDPPGSNQVMFSKWYGVIGPWCAMFVSYNWVQAKSKAFKKGERYAYCPYVYDDAKHHRNNLTLVPAVNARPGDLVLYDWKGDNVADHIGILLTKVDRNGWFMAIEGNTSGTSPSDGGMVAEMRRNSRDVIGFVRVLA